MAHYRTVWISDFHLGTRGSNVAPLLDFLRTTECDALYIVGDLIDVWSLRRRRYWPQSHSDVIQKLLRKGRKGTRLIYIPGNHDELLRKFTGEYGNLSIVKHAIHETADGRRLLVMHGDELDTVVQNIRWLAVLGDVGYQLLLALNVPLNFLRRLFGLGYWSLSAHVKRKVKNAVAFVGAFEQAIVRYAQDHQVDGVVCGHIHSPAIRPIGDITYYNCGDFVESCSALVEHADGTIELLRDLHRGITNETPDDEDPFSTTEDPEAEEKRPTKVLLLPSVLSVSSVFNPPSQFNAK